MPTTHKALLYKEPHGKYTLEKIPTPSPGKGEVLVKVHSVALNPVDWKVPKYHPEATSLLLANGYPGILGCDVAGEVTDIGEDVTTFDKHDRVFGQSEKYNDGHGGFQQFTLMSADTISKIPPSLTYDAASTIPLGLSTSYSGFYAEEPDGLGLTSPAEEGGFGKYKNIPIVILGGATSVGQYAIQLAKISGFSPIITTASLKHADVLKTYGATHVLDRNLSTTQTISTIKSITEKEIILAYDGVSSSSTQQLALDIVASGGLVALVLPPSITPPNDKRFSPVFAGVRCSWNEKLFQSLYLKVHKWIEDGFIIPNRHEALPDGLNGIFEGLARMERDEVSRLKLVAHPQETI